MPDASVDIVVCAQVYEHTADAPALVREVWRVLRTGGVCFFSGPNRLAIVEEHYWLPFLSWLPQRLADRYMRLFKRGERYDIDPLFYWQIRHLWGGFVIFDYTVPMLRHPDRFGLSERLGRLRWLSRLPAWLFRLLMPLLPNYNWILVKSKDTFRSNAEKVHPRERILARLL
jgi:SAM-dependent methyltransferase